MQYKSFEQCLHHYFEFLERDLTVSVLVDFGQDLLPDFLADLGAHSQHFFDLVYGNGSAAIFVIQGKCLLKLLILEQLVSVDSGGDELTKVNLATVVDVH